jgi:hypothetical protein
MSRSNYAILLRNYDAILGLPSGKQQHQGTKLRFAKLCPIFNRQFASFSAKAAQKLYKAMI